MSWRWLLVFVVVMLGASAAGGVALGDWLVAKAPSITAESRTNTTRPPEIVLDAAGRPLAGLAPQPLVDGSLGLPQTQIQPMWEIQAVSLFETNLDPMVVLGRGNESYSVSDMLSKAGDGLVQGPNDIATVDVTGGDAEDKPKTPTAIARVDPSGSALPWQQQLSAAIAACDKVSFFSRPDCVERARKKFCDPNNAWGRDALCPNPFSAIPS